MTTPLRIAILGLGEAGSAFAHDLVALGANVRAYDPKTAAPPNMDDRPLAPKQPPPSDASAPLGHPSPTPPRPKQSQDLALRQPPPSGTHEPLSDPQTTPPQPRESRDLRPEPPPASRVDERDLPPAASAPRDLPPPASPRPRESRDLGPERPSLSGVELRSSDADAVRDAALVFSLTSGAEAEATLRASLPGLREGTVWAEANTASPALKRAMAELAPGVRFVDVAIMAPVPAKGLRTPMYASGVDAVAFSSMMETFGVGVEVVPGGVGAASSRKLLRSVVYKGLAAAVVEATAGAEAAGCAEWFAEHLTSELQSFDADTLRRLITGTHLHAQRRAEEMDAAARQLDDLGVASTIATATRDTLRALTSEESQ
ncbi:MAG TPA: DUF1932 domain-containing protein [Stackebrandtia sp.]|uniref:NAD(P)-dependent oxidoreductase n=1 Tax=Stackebrandtia sp. TaxID=2023065 RepID=UPI002D5DAF91|nr:DUF1932 domain-containing protein [Stackebrandtia sp.]HZE40859.1 DUF1932 domain-containing protein [Stackebrandtia sp.]